MVTAIVLALVVSVTAALVLNMTFRRFELSAFRTDRAVAGGTSEAGFQYVFARLARDNAFRTAVETKRLALGAGAQPANNAAAEYVISCHDDPAAAEDVVLDPDGAGNQQPPALHMGGVLDATSPGGLRGGKHVRLRIRFFTAADIALLPPAQAAILTSRPYRVRSFSWFGTGAEWS